MGTAYLFNLNKQHTRKAIMKKRPTDEILALAESGNASDLKQRMRLELAFRIAMIYVPEKHKRKVLEHVREHVVGNPKKST